MNWFVIVLAVLVVGCSPIEGAKKIWGSSTQTLERERVNAIRQTYACAINDCFEAIKTLTQGKDDEGGVFEIFIENKAKYMFVVIGVPESVDTTEVGIFLNPVKSNETSIEISSLSSNAKRKVAEILQLSLEQKYPK